MRFFGLGGGEGGALGDQALAQVGLLGGEWFVGPADAGGYGPVRQVVLGRGFGGLVTLSRLCHRCQLGPETPALAADCVPTARAYRLAADIQDSLFEAAGRRCHWSGSSSAARTARRMWLKIHEVAATATSAPRAPRNSGTEASRR